MDTKSEGDKLRGKDKIKITETAALSLEIMYSETENMFCRKRKLLKKKKKNWIE